MVVKSMVSGLISVAIIAALVVIVPPAVQSHGEGMEFTNREFAGPYEVAIGTAPDPLAVGKVLISFVVIEMSSRTVVLGADINVTGRGPDARIPDIGPAPAFEDPTDPSFYDLNTSIDRKGEWTFDVSVSAEPGDGDAVFVLEVAESSAITGIITLVAVLVVVAAIGVALRMFLKEKGKGRRVKRRRKTA
ncbi:MAG: hypothetical protein FI707_15635 [SAR202 cluster bacterium]|nr:hypothetical protein [SAR202 cluster bacterium]HAL49392.1 hypothetical protein [Dehalococcoidia bacterium]MDP6664231.1 hypothetical protein [SAR202 cluster bacterium]MDP6799418.1 hypothetical protein [SAR202 cluster bacterium]MQG57921.1 hypothetical protein [SAR202 cluster bacterium]